MNESHSTFARRASHMALLWSGLLSSAIAVAQEGPEETCRAFEELYEVSDVRFASDYAYCLVRGIGMEKNLPMAENVLVRAVELGSSDAKISLAAIMLFELGDPDRYDEAIELLLDVNESGHGGAAFSLFLAAASGRGTARSQVDAVQWLHQSVAEGGAHVDALMLFGVYEIGLLGQKQNSDSANEYWGQFLTEFGVTDPELIAVYCEPLASDQILRVAFSAKELDDISEACISKVTVDGRR